MAKRNSCGDDSCSRQADYMLCNSADQRQKMVDAAAPPVVSTASTAEKSASGTSFDEKSIRMRVSPSVKNAEASSSDDHAVRAGSATEADDDAERRRIVPANGVNIADTTVSLRLQPSPMATVGRRIEASQPSTKELPVPLVRDTSEDIHPWEARRAKELQRRDEMEFTAATAAAGLEWQDLRGDTVTALVRQLARYSTAVVKPYSPQFLTAYCNLCFIMSFST